MPVSYTHLDVYKRQVYGLLRLYVVVELKKRMVDAICICGVALCLVTVLQTVLFLPMGLLYYLVPYEDFLVLITNGGVFIILKLLKKTNKYSKTKEFLENSGIKIIISMFVLIYIYFYFAHIFKITGKIPIEIYATVSYTHLWQKKKKKLQHFKQQLLFL